ncbi:permease prefix domain 1-containing protein [Aminipila sp.]|uniref:permease prefix domain 1-containing protein n=1 Tax=Aminipila sp. TaxID=2060095 RepID=UPI00289A7857|nr:permease prefix domain 1-containing protein [Aminipila sp.]
MNQIRNYIEVMFSSLPNTHEVVEMKLNMLENMEEKFQELLKDGKNENEAVGIILADFGSMEELKEELGISNIQLQGVECNSCTPENSSLKEEYFSFKRRYGIALAIACTFFIIAPFIYVFLKDLYKDSSSISLLIFFCLIACGVGICIYYRTQDSHYKELLYINKNEETRTSMLVKSTIFSIATVIYLGVGFLGNLWHPTWIIFIVAAMISRLSTAIIDGRMYK